MAKGICPVCDKESNLIKDNSICRPCNMRKAKEAKKAEAPSVDEVAADVTVEASEEATEMSRAPRTRKKRKTLAERRTCAVNPDATDPNMVYRVFNDNPLKPGRIQQAEEGGWTVVTRKKGPNGEELNNMLFNELTSASKGLGSAITQPVGGGVTGVLMYRPRDEYDEDMEFVAREAKKREEAIFGDPNEDQQYRPAGISTEVGVAAFTRSKE